MTRRRQFSAHAGKTNKAANRNKAAVLRLGQDSGYEGKEAHLSKKSAVLIAERILCHR